MPLGVQDDTSRSQPLAGQAELVRELAFTDQNPHLFLSGRTRDPVLRADWQLGPGHLLDVIPENTGCTLGDRRRLLWQNDDGTGLTLLGEGYGMTRRGEDRYRQDYKECGEY